MDVSSYQVAVEDEDEYVNEREAAAYSAYCSLLTELGFVAANRYHPVHLPIDCLLQLCGFHDTEILIVAHQPSDQLRGDRDIQGRLEVPLGIRPGGQFLRVVPRALGHEVGGQVGFSARILWEGIVRSVIIAPNAAGEHSVLLRAGYGRCGRTAPNHLRRTSPPNVE